MVGSPSLARSADGIYRTVRSGERPDFIIIITDADAPWNKELSNYTPPRSAEQFLNLMSKCRRLVRELLI